MKLGSCRLVFSGSFYKDFLALLLPEGRPIDFIAEGGLVSFCIEFDLDSNFELGHLSACPDEFRGSIFFRLGMFPL